MAKTSKKNLSLKFGDASAALGEKGYVRCPTCRRDVKDPAGHATLHENGTLGDDGRRTDRSAAEAKTWAERYNGTDATEAFRRVVAPKAKKAAAAKKSVAKKAVKKAA